MAGQEIENNLGQQNTIEVPKTFEFERLLRTVSTNLNEKDMEALNLFKQTEMTISSDIEMSTIDKSSQLVEKLETSFQQFMKSVNETRMSLSNAFQGNPNPDSAKGNWDAGKEFETRELHENTLISIQNYVERSYAEIRDRYTTLLSSLKKKSVEKPKTVIEIANRTKNESQPFKPTPLHDVMGYSSDENTVD